MSEKETYLDTKNKHHNAVVSVLFYDAASKSTETFYNYYTLSLVAGRRLRSFKKNDTTFESILLVDCETCKFLIENEIHHSLSETFDKIIVSDDNKGFFLKLDVWKLAPSYDKIVYLDLDCWVFNHEGLDLLFQTIEKNTHAEIFACCEATWPDMFNTGVFGISRSTAISYPELKKHQESFNLLKASNSDLVELYDELDQGLLNFVFADSWQKLPYVFNVQIRQYAFTESYSASASPATYFAPAHPKKTNPGYPKQPSKDSYFDPSSKTPSESDHSDQQPQGSYFYVPISNCDSTSTVSPTHTRFLNKALILQFMEKPWQTCAFEHLAPHFYAQFCSLKQNQRHSNEAIPAIPDIPDIAGLSINPAQHVKRTDAYIFPWEKYPDFPSANKRTWA